MNWKYQPKSDAIDVQVQTVESLQQKLQSGEKELVTAWALHDIQEKVKQLVDIQGEQETREFIKNLEY